MDLPIALARHVLVLDLAVSRCLGFSEHGVRHAGRPSGCSRFWPPPAFSGTTIGGFATKPLVDAVGAENLIIGWALAFFAATFVIRLALQDVQEAPLRSRWDQPSLVQDVQSGYKFVRKSELMRWVPAGALLMGTLFFFVVFPFSKGVTQEFPDEDATAGFIGVFEGLTTACSICDLLISCQSDLRPNRVYGRAFNISRDLSARLRCNRALSGICHNRSFAISPARLAPWHCGHRLSSSL